MTAHGNAPPPFCNIVALALAARVTLLLPKILAKKVCA